MVLCITPSVVIFTHSWILPLKCLSYLILVITIQSTFRLFQLLARLQKF